ncbi:MAG: aldo/keto reductase [Chitinivibrionales bacterium]|nr:aldo/keto reductase [Chitinivibrionales bacterium]
MKISELNNDTIHSGTRITIAEGVEMPIIGFGTYQLDTGKQTEESVLKAFESGYRLIDTAAIYHNEKEVGKAIASSNIPRDEVFVTTKLWNDKHGAAAAQDGLHRSLEALQLDYVDLYLIHWPEGGALEQTWGKLVQLQHDGLCRSVGVSNFMQKHIEIIEKSSEIAPAVNQILFNIKDYPEELSRYCSNKGITVEAYSPLAQGSMSRSETLSSIAGKYGRSRSQIMLRWAIQNHAVPVPRSANPLHISENIDVFGFKLSSQDMDELNNAATL